MGHSCEGHPPRVPAFRPLLRRSRGATNKTAAWSADLERGNSEPARVSAIGAEPLGEHRHEQNSPRVPAFRPLLRRSRGATEGQVVVELLLILPVFMLMLFFIMELGNLAYQTILVNHSAYELARIGSLIAGPEQGGGGSNIGLARQKMKNSLCDMYKNCGSIQMVVSSEYTYQDPQVLATGLTHINEDLLVKLVFPARLVFPGSNFFLASPPRGRGIRWITVMVRMPIEKPFFQ